MNRIYKMIWYTTVDRLDNSQHEETVMTNRIVRLSKDKDNFDITLIFLDTGEVLRTSDSMKTLWARINSNED